MKNDVAQVLRNNLDRRIEPLRAAQASAQRPARGWLRAVREAVGLNQAEVAEKLGVTRQSYAQFETAEARGSIGIASLQRAADAIGCELVYFVVPREAIARTFSELMQRHDPEFHHLQASEHSMSLEGQAVGDLRPAPKPPS